MKERKVSVSVTFSLSLPLLNRKVLSTERRHEGDGRRKMSLTNKLSFLQTSLRFFKHAQFIKIDEIS